MTDSSAFGLQAAETWDEVDDPVLLGPRRDPVGTWREGYPYDERMTRHDYEFSKRLLQIELLKMQAWVKEPGARIVMVFEGRDAAGKGGTIKRFMEHMNPRGATVVALEKPTSEESTQWYFQRYISTCPVREIVMFDRSWYNRAGVERVMGFCTQGEYEEFMRQAPEFERMLVRSGIILFKFWFSVSRSEQVHPVHDPKDRPGAPVEAVADGPGQPGPVARLHRRQGSDAVLHHTSGPVDRRALQRQEARPARGHALGALDAGLSGSGRGDRRQPGPLDRRSARRDLRDGEHTGRVCPNLTVTESHREAPFGTQSRHATRRGR